MTLRTYTFNHNGEYGFYTGHDSLGKQYLLGMMPGSIITFQFSAEGDCLFVWEDRAPYGHYEETLTFIMTVHEITLCPIVVTHFHSQKHAIQIRDLNPHYEEFLEQRHTMTLEKQRLYDDAITEWLEARQFVFLWGRRSYWLDGEGTAVPH